VHHCTVSMSLYFITLTASVAVSMKHLSSVSLPVLCIYRMIHHGAAPDMQTDISFHLYKVQFVTIAALLLDFTV